MSDDALGSLTRRGFLQVSAAASLVPPLPLGAAKTTMPVTHYLLTRLKEHGVEVLFGVPGATCDPLFAAANGGLMSVVVNSSDLEAGYAADGYARVKGLSAVSVTYGVGMMSLLAPIGGAYAERSPVVVINGGPSAEDLRLQKEFGTFFSHSIGKEKTDLSVFREVTAFAERVERAEDVPRVVDAALRTALTQQRPVYLEIPKHLWEATCAAPTTPLELTVAPTGEEERVATEVLSRLASATRPVVLLGIELQRYGLVDDAIAVVGKLGLPWATTLLAKGVIPEQTPGFVGVYAGERSVPSVKKLVEDADVVLALGTVMGRQYRKLVTQTPNALVLAANDVVRNGKKPAVKATLKPFLAALTKQAVTAAPSTSKSQGLSFEERRASIASVKTPAVAEPGLSYDDVMSTVSGLLDETLLTITDTSLSMYPAAELNVVGRNGFLCNAVWQAIGFSVGAAVGVSLGQSRRVLAICGDGGFQMTAQAVSTMAQRQLPCIVVVLDNGLYAIEQFLLDAAYFTDASRSPKPYLRLNGWNYVDFAKSLGVTNAVAAATKEELKRALLAAKAAKGPAFISARIRPHDLPSGLRA